MANLALMRNVNLIPQRHLAKQLGIDTSAVRHAEARGLRRWSTAAKYAKALGCAPADVLEPNNN